MVEGGARTSSSPRGGAALVPAIVVVLGAILFTALSITSRVLFDQTEERLLDQRVGEAAAVLELAVAQVRAPLDAALELASATGGDPRAFTEALGAEVAEGQMFSSAVLLRTGSAEPVAEVGARAHLLDEPGRVTALFAPDAPFKIVDLLADGRRLGYAVTDPQDPSYVVYAERVLSPDPSVRQRNDEPFAHLDYAIYLGAEELPQRVLGGSVAELPMTGRVSEKTFPFGDQQLLLTMSPMEHLSSDLFSALWWIILLVGAALTTCAAWLTRRLLVGRDTALALSGENQRLYQEQRQIAETLQLSLLPQRLSLPPGTEVAARYWPAGSAALIGGDFYDAFDIGDGRWGITIGDVCGKGIGSAALIGLARHTLRSAARHTTSPSEVLRTVHHAMADHEPSTFCTACFVFVSPRIDGGLDLELSLGGHPHPVVRRVDGSIETPGVAGSLLGMFEPTLVDVHISLAGGDLLMLYTDGLTDAPKDEAVPLDEIYETLRVEGDSPLEVLAEKVRSLKRRRRPRGSADDTAVVLVRAGSVPIVGSDERVESVTAN